MRTRAEHLAAMLADPDDRRHGTMTGYAYGCRCERCRERRRAYEAERCRTERERLAARSPKRRGPAPFPAQAPKRGKPKAAGRKAPGKDVCTVPAELMPMMGKPSVKRPFCCVCGATSPLNEHHVVFRSSGRWVRGGVEVRKPTVTLCGDGNASGCHGLAHRRRLHFRWAETANEVRTPSGSFEAAGGHWEYLLTDEPCKRAEALAMGGWRRL